MIGQFASRPVGDLLACLWGPTVWAGHFFVLYAAETLLCTQAATPARHSYFLVIAAGATVIAVASLILLMVRELRVEFAPGPASSPADAPSSFLRYTSMMLALLALLGVLWAALPLMLIAGCAGAGR